MVLLICQVLGWFSYAVFAWVAAHAILILFAALRRRRILKELQLLLQRARMSGAEKLLFAPSDTKERKHRRYLKAVLSQVAKELQSGHPTIARQRIDELCDVFYFNADAVFVYANLATRAGLFGTVLGIIAWFGSGEIHGPESMTAVGYALGTTATGLVLASIIELAISRVFEPAWSEFCSSVRSLLLHLEQQLPLVSAAQPRQESNDVADMSEPVQESAVKNGKGRSDAESANTIALANSDTKSGVEESKSTFEPVTRHRSEVTAGDDFQATEGYSQSHHDGIVEIPCTGRAGNNVETTSCCEAVGGVA